jgi:hypothetical protein
MMADGACACSSVSICKLSFYQSSMGFEIVVSCDLMKAFSKHMKHEKYSGEIFQRCHCRVCHNGVRLDDSARLSFAEDVAY